MNQAIYNGKMSYWAKDKCFLIKGDKYNYEFDYEFNYYIIYFIDSSVWSKPAYHIKEEDFKLHFTTIRELRKQKLEILKCSVKD